MPDVLATLKKLPPICAARHPVTNRSILIVRGVSGYYPADGLDVDAYNRRHGITAAQVFAMEAGSAFGWDVPAADPDTHRAA